VLESSANLLHVGTTLTLQEPFLVYHSFVDAPHRS